ncbi:MAG: hypothetical protein ACD_15C00024G0001 [uncultured bacterium]|nr:MAG: hypothetical protein ACD_15C00024G0001 [uncultured bacterium]
MGKLHHDKERPSDSELVCRIIDFLRIIKEEGFETINTFKFLDSSYHKCLLYLCFHEKDGILLLFTTYQGCSINEARLYFNWKPSGDPDITVSYLSGGKFHEASDGFIWIGDQDCRQSIRSKLYELRKHGHFIAPWVKRPLLFMLRHIMKGEANEFGFKEINLGQIAHSLPSEVLHVIANRN